MYYPDLSPYSYDSHGEDEFEAIGTLNIGWLSKGYDFNIGESSEQFLDRVFEFCSSSVSHSRGLHLCELCEYPPSRDEIKSLTYFIRYGKEILLGGSQIRVIGKNQIFGAPNLIYHYIEEHKYLPPPEFIEAVLTGPLPAAAEYQELKNKYWVRTVRG